MSFFFLEQVCTEMNIQTTCEGADFCANRIAKLSARLLMITISTSRHSVVIVGIKIVHSTDGRILEVNIGVLRKY